MCHINPTRPSGFARSPDAPTTFVPMSAVDDTSGTIVAPQVRAYRDVAKGYTFFQEGDVLFAKITPCMQNGKAAIAMRLLDGVGFGSTEFHVLRPGPNVFARWIHLAVRRPRFREEATRYFTGAVGQQRVPEDFVARSLIPLPPVEEQRRIAARLSEQMAQVEHMRQAAQAQAEAARALPAAFLRQVFESEQAKTWPRRRLGVVCQKPQYGFTASATREKVGPKLLRITCGSSVIMTPVFGSVKMSPYEGDSFIEPEGTAKGNGLEPC
ncbi:MAG: restriction endonuclease subunit S [Chloroflexi bacterium]|nr:restriction endonuclease subunit S [Chloroflexota bacterium]